MSCTDYLIWITGHLDGTNTVEEEKLLQDHLTSCKDCSKSLQELTKIDRTMKEVLPAPPERISRNVMAVVRKDAKRRKQQIRNYLLSTAAIAAVLCLVLISSLRFPNKDVPNPEVEYTSPDQISQEPALVSDGEGQKAYSGEDSRESRGFRVNSEDTVASGGYSSKSIGSNELYHCVFVSVHSQADIPQGIVLADTTQFIDRITKDARDYYYYGDSPVLGATLLSYEELESLNMEVTSEFPQDTSSNTYVVVFALPNR